MVTVLRRRGAWVVAAGVLAGSLAACGKPAQTTHQGEAPKDMVLKVVTAGTVTALDPAAIAVAGDTPSDIASGRAAGASVVAGVLTGNATRDELAAAGATRVLATITELPALLT